MALCFLDVAIGDRAAHAQQQAAFTRSAAALTNLASSYGFKPTFAAMNDEEKTAFAEFYSAQHSDPLSMAPPPPLPGGRIVIGLDDEAAPKACENFRGLCAGTHGVGKVSGKPLTYRDAPFHRIIPGFCAQGGDFIFGDGSGKDTVFGKPTFNDEKGGLKRKLEARGLLCMANNGKNSNGCQFFFTLAPLPKLDGLHVVFGRIVEVRVGLLSLMRWSLSLVHTRAISCAGHGRGGGHGTSGQRRWQAPNCRHHHRLRLALISRRAISHFHAMVILCVAPSKHAKDAPTSTAFACQSQCTRAPCASPSGPQ